MSRGVILLMVGMAGCVGGASAACVNSLETLCGTCPKSDDQDLVCKCLGNRELGLGDFDDVQQTTYGVETDDDAQRWCDSTVLEIEYVSEAERTECRETSAFLADYGADACADLGWEAD